MNNVLYAYRPIAERRPIRWPGDAKVAFYIGLYVESVSLDRPLTSLRVGAWRTVQTLDRYGMRASGLLDSDACARYPQIIEAGLERDWAWLAHGRDIASFRPGMSADEQGAHITELVDTIATATGARPAGWLGRGLTEQAQTPMLLAELGLTYVLDWTNDDQPYRLDAPGMFSVPFTVELDDRGLFGFKGVNGPEFVQIVKDQYEQLHADGDHGGQVMALALHPLVIGQPFRARYLDRALEYLAAQPGIWLTTSDEIAGYYEQATRRLP